MIPIGTEMKCEICGTEIIKKSYRQKYCLDCAHKVYVQKHVQYKRKWIENNKEYYRNQQKEYRRKKRIEEKSKIMLGEIR